MTGLPPQATRMNMISFPLTLFLLSFVTASCRTAPQDVGTSITVGDRERCYIEYIADSIPDAGASPLLLVLHGGGGSASEAQDSFDFNRIADQYGVLIAYPNAVNGHWNDGRGGSKFAKQDAVVDDVLFCTEVIKDMERKHSVDASKIYAVGASNGGMMVQRLAIDVPQHFTAVASIISGIPEPIAGKLPKNPGLSVLFMNGTQDPIVPYTGGEVVLNLFPRLRDRPKTQGRGRILGSVASVELWCKSLGLAGKPALRDFPDIEPTDKATVQRSTWSHTKDSLQVVLYSIRGGGHTIPGRAHRMAERIVGATCLDIDAQQEIWRFFADKQRPKT